jgi:photosystem II stability/assembly factor-like uncharacterized protein
MAKPRKTSPSPRNPRRGTDSKPLTVPKPRRLVPGIEGRSAWFARRAGAHEWALSLERLRSALEAAESMPDKAAILEVTLQDALTLLSRLGKPARDRVRRTPTLLDFSGRVQDVKIRGQTEAVFTTLSPPLEVGGAGFLFVPLGARSASHLDIDDLIVADISERERLRLNHTFTYWPEEDLLVGRLWHGGVYQVHGWPRDPLLRAGFETVARYWPFIERGSDDTPADAVVERLVGLLLLNGLDERQARALIGGVRPPFVKQWWDRGVFERPKEWRSVGPFPTQDVGGIGRVTQIAIHPIDGNILIAGAAGGGVWRTNNGGVSWWPTMQLQPTLTIGAVAIAPSQPQIMYAASGEDGGFWNPAWGGVGLYRSNNGGVTWTLMTSVPSTRFSAIAVHPSRPDTVYLAGNRGLHKSTDGGMTWRVNPGHQSLFNGQITDVVVAFEEPALTDHPSAAFANFPFPLFAEHVYIGVANMGVYRSTVAGEQSGATTAFTRLDSPNQLPSGYDAGWIKLALGRRGAHRTRFLAAKMGRNGSRIFTTIDGGTSWTERAQDVASVEYDEWCSLIAVDPLDENILYAGAAWALKRTLNGGSAPGDWMSIAAGVHADQQGMVFDPVDSRRVFLANDGGVYRSSNRGDSWTFAAGYLAVTQLYDIDISEKSRQVVVGGAQDNGIYYRDEFGYWRNMGWGDGTQVAIDPTMLGVFYFSSQNGLPHGLGRSANAGHDVQGLGQTGLSGDSPWVTIIKLEPRDPPVTNPLIGRVMFVCGVRVLFRSTDSGQTWRCVQDGAGNPFQSFGDITALEFAVSDPSILYLGTAYGALYRAVNGGRNAADWTRIDTPGSSADVLFPGSGIQAIRVNAGNANDVWLVFGGSGVSFTDRPDRILNPTGISHLFRNRDATNINGWEDVSGSFAALSLPDVPTSAAALDDMDPEVAYAGTDVGVFRTTDGGDTWAAFQDGLPRSPVVELLFNRRFRRLFAGTMGRGIYIRDV